MSCCDRLKLPAAFALLLLSTASPAAEHLVGIGGEFDSEEGKAFSVFGSFAVAEKTWLSATASRSNSRGDPFDLNSLYADVGLDHHFDPVGVRVGAAYWGDPDLLDSNDLRAALYLRNDFGSLSIDYERRAFDLTLELSPLLDARRFEFDADGVGASLRVDLGERVSVYASGMTYDYSRNIAAQPNVDRLRIFALTRLSTVNSLLDERLSGGVEFTLGSRMLDLRAASWRTAVFGDRVTSLGIGLLTPLGGASDLELRLSSDDSDTSGRATLFSVFLYFYGE